MRNPSYPLVIPRDLLKEMRKTAKETGLSLADAMRQSMKLGAPRLREHLGSARLKPFTKEEERRAWGVPNAEFDALEHHCAGLPKPPPEE